MMQIGWEISTVLFVSGVVVALLIGRGFIRRPFVPLAAFVLVVMAVFLAINLERAYARHLDYEDEKMQVVSFLREASASLNDYRRMLAEGLAQAQEQQGSWDPVAFTAGARAKSGSVFAGLRHDRVLLKHVSSATYGQMLVLADQLEQSQRELGAAKAAQEFTSLLQLQQRDVELLTKILSWETIYQLGGFGFDKLTEFMGQLMHRPADTARAG